MKHHDIATRLSVPILPLVLFSACGGSGGGPEITVQDPLTMTPPVVVVDMDSASLAWDTSLPASALVVVSTSGPESTLGPYFIPGPQQNFQVDLSNLMPGTSYQFQVTVTAPDGRVLVGSAQDFTTLSTLPFASTDFFSNNLDWSRWELRGPAGAGELRMLATTTGEGVLEYEVPVGVHSSPWLTLDATRLTQRVPNSDLALEVVFESGMDREATGQGLVFEQDDQTWARFDFAFNANKLQIFGGTFAGGVLQNMHTTNLQTGAWLDGETLAMRVTRTGNQFVQQYSLQGGPWTTAATFNLPMELNYAGIMLASEGDPSEGIVSRIDSIQNLASPLVNEDGTLATDATGPYPYVAEALHLGDGLVRLAWSTDEPANAVLHYGPTPAMAEGSIDFATDAFQHEWWLGGLELDSQYSFQIESFDALGNRSTKDLIVDVPAEAPLGSPAIALWSQSQTVQGITTVRFGDLGFAQPQINLLGNVSDDDEDRLIQHVTLEYQLDGGAWLPLAMGDDRTISYAPWRLANEGDYNVELMLADLMQGTPVGGLFVHDVLLRAQDDEGHTAYRLLRVEVVDGATWDPSASVDWSAILAGGGGPEQGVQIVDGRWHVENVPGIGAALRTDPAHLGYDRLVAIGQGTGASAWENYEATLDATILALDPQGYTTGTASYGFGFVMRWTGHTSGGNYDQPNHNIYPLGGAYLYRWFDDRERWELWTGYDEGIASLPGNTLAVGTRYSFKLRAETQVGGGSRYRMKMWPFGSTEPVAWTFDRTTPVEDGNNLGSLLLVAHHADVAFGNIQVTPLP